MLKIVTLGMNFKIIFLYASLLIIVKESNAALYNYKFTYVTYIAKVSQNETQISETQISGANTFHVCQLGKEVKFEICKEAIREKFAADNEIVLLDHLPVAKQQWYELKRSGFEFEGQSPIVTKACICPTNPPLYLEDGSSDAQVKDPNTTMATSSDDPIIHICELKEEDKMHICKEALQHEHIVESSIKLVQNTSVLPTRFYDVVVSVYTTAPPTVMAACICPTNPPIYLKDESSGKEVYAYVCQEDSYADVIHRINNPDEGDNDTTTES